MKKILQYLLAHDIDEVKLDSCISKFSFENVTGRKPGEEDVYSFVRKGIVETGRTTSRGRRGKSLTTMPDRPW